MKDIIVSILSVLALLGCVLIIVTLSIILLPFYIITLFVFLIIDSFKIKGDIDELERFKKRS